MGSDCDAFWCLLSITVAAQNGSGDEWEWLLTRYIVGAAVLTVPPHSYTTTVSPNLSTEEMSLSQLEVEVVYSLPRVLTRDA